jgi:hypothetical protein
MASFTNFLLEDVTAKEPQTFSLAAARTTSCATVDLLSAAWLPNKSSSPIDATCREIRGLPNRNSTLRSLTPLTGWSNPQCKCSHRRTHTPATRTAQSGRLETFLNLSERCSPSSGRSDDIRIQDYFTHPLASSESCVKPGDRGAMLLIRYRSTGPGSKSRRDHTRNRASPCSAQEAHTDRDHFLMSCDSGEAHLAPNT